MKHLLEISLTLLLAGWASTGLAADSENPERGPDTGSYTIDEPAQPLASSVPALLADPTPERTLAIPTALAELRARHLATLQQLEQAILLAQDPVERHALEERAQALKTTQQQEDLLWLKADALQRGDAAYATRLDAALLALEPVPAPVATRFVPRDPLSGRALDGSEEGGLQ
jgi:hypothetical protein